MSHLNPGLISAYNSLTDKHLAGYFSNTRIRRHLQRAGLITRSGRIVPDKEYRHKLVQRAHQRHVRECLAQAIFHKVLEMERVHQIEIKRKLEEFARRERVHKIKVERSKRYEEDLIRILSPRPPTGARSIRKQHSGPEGEHSESSESPGSSRPNTAPGKMQRPVRLKPIHSNSTTASLRRSSPYRHHESSTENNQPFNCTVYRESRRQFNTTEATNGLSPYCLPVINNFVTPVPPPTKRKERGLKLNPSGTLRGRRLRPTTASSGADITEDPPMLRSSVHQSRVCVNMMYCGKTVHLSHDLSDMRDEIKVFQQHCGGENLCVYKGKLREGETFQFISRRHRGFPFSLTFFLNGLQVERLSSCCEFKHRKGSRLGGRHGHFGFCGVEGASPCYKCIIAMGLDKKPTPPPKRVKEDQGKEESAITLKEAPEMRTERRGSHSEYETSQPQADTETQVKGETAAEARDDYEEDFEADDEGPVEDTEAKEKKQTSPSADMERKAKEREDSETEDDNEKDDIKSRSGSSSSGSEREDSDTETTTREEDKAEQPTEVDEEEAAVPPDEKDDPQPEEDPTTKEEPAAPKDSDVPNSAGESTEIDISDTSVPSGNENKQSDDTSGEKEVDIMVHENKQEEEQERAKSVQEKLAEAILKESQCSSEPELSDTSTDDTVESTGRGRDHKDATAEKKVALIEEQKPVEEERKCEEGVVALAVAVAVMDQETMLEQKQAEDTEQEPPENSETTKEEEVKVKEEDNKVALEEDETPAEESKSDEKEVAAVALLAVSTEVAFENNKTPEAQEDVAGKAVDASENKEENEEKAAGEADMHPQETGQGAKSSMEDESSVSESNKETDETAVTDTAEAEAMTASETMEIKAEPSEEREALSCEEAPVTGTETSQLGDDEDGAAASKTEVTEGSGDTPDEKNAETSEDDAKEESVKDIKEELLLASEACEDDNQQDSGDPREEEQTEKSDEREGKSEEEKKEEGKQTNADETTESEHVEESEVHAKDRTEEETNNESKTEEKTEHVSNEEQAEKTHSEEKRGEKEEEADRSEKTENDEDGDCVKNKNDEDELIEKAAAAVIIANAAETITVADEQKKDQIVNKAEQSETVKTRDHEESQETKVVTYTTVEVEEKSEKEKEPRKKTDADVDEDSVKESDDNVESEAAVNAALATVMTAEMLSTIEAEDVANKTDNNEKGDVNAENGEISTGAESKPQEDEGEAQTEGENGVTAEKMESERETEEQKEDEVTAESVDCAEKHENVSAQASDRAEAETEAKEEDVEKQDQSGEKDSELEKSGDDLKGESESDIIRDDEETKQDENANLSEADYENREIEKSSSQENINEVIVVSSADQVQSTTPTAADSDETPLKSERSTALSDNHTHKHPNTDENPAAADPSAADGENGDTEEASKASEEGASVLLKPQAQSEQPTQENEADKTEEKAAVVEETADVLAREDLVTNWVNVHQTSKFFETFVEPMEDLKEVTTEANSKEEETQPTELQRSVSPLKESETVEPEHAQDVDESVEKNKEESKELDIESDGKDGEPCKKDKEKDAPQVEEETEVQGFILKTESELTEPVEGQEMRSEDLKGRQGSLEEDKAEESTPQDNTDQAGVSKTVVESIPSAPLSVTSGKPESIPENQTEEKTDDDAELNEKPTAVEEVTDLSASKTEEQPQHTDASLDFKDKDEMLEKSREVTEISEFTESRSDDSSQKETHHDEIKSKQSDGNVNGEKRDLQLIQDITHTLSKERLSTFSVDETLFGPGSYPLLAAAQTDSGH